MAKYIDADKLITEIERLQHLNECYKRNWRWKFKWFSRTVIGRMEVLEGIKNFINSLQQEQQEVDVEEEIDLWISENENIHHGDKLMVWLLKEVAHHFYGLSKNSK